MYTTQRLVFLKVRSPSTNPNTHREGHAGKQSVWTCGPRFWTLAFQARFVGKICSLALSLGIFATNWTSPSRRSAQRHSNDFWGLDEMPPAPPCVNQNWQKRTWSSSLWWRLCLPGPTLLFPRPWQVNKCAQGMYYYNEARPEKRS